MTPRRVAAIVAGAVLVSTLLAGCTSQPSAGPTSAEPTPSSTPSETIATPTPTPVEATCENTATAGYQAGAAEIGWVSWVLPYDGIGASPFEEFPGGIPAGQITCRWGADPDLATDNVLDLAWAPIGVADAEAAQAHLAESGYERIDAPEGIYFAMRGEMGWGDDEGFASTFLFTADDVRWSWTKADVASVKAPDDAG